MGVAGLQPKRTLADRAKTPIPTLIVKMGADRDPGVSASAFLCMRAALDSGFEQSDSGTLVILDRFFEQVAFIAMVRNCDDHLENFGINYSSEPVVPTWAKHGRSLKFRWLVLAATPTEPEYARNLAVAIVLS